MENKKESVVILQSSNGNTVLISFYKSKRILKLLSEYFEEELKTGEFDEESWGVVKHSKQLLFPKNLKLIFISTFLMRLKTTRLMGKFGNTALNKIYFKKCKLVI